MSIVRIPGRDKPRIGKSIADFIDANHPDDTLLGLFAIRLHAEAERLSASQAAGGTSARKESVAAVAEADAHLDRAVLALYHHLEARALDGDEEAAILGGRLFADGVGFTRARVRDELEVVDALLTAAEHGPGVAETGDELTAHYLRRMRQRAATLGKLLPPRDANEDEGDADDAVHDAAAAEYDFDELFREFMSAVAARFPRRKSIARSERAALLRPYFETLVNLSTRRGGR